MKTKFILLHEIDPEMVLPLIVNIAHIVQLKPMDEDRYTRIYLSTGCVVDVEETTVDIYLTLIDNDQVICLEPTTKQDKQCQAKTSESSQQITTLNETSGPVDQKSSMILSSVFHKLQLILKKWGFR